MNLRQINVVVGLAHLVQATLMLALGNDLALPFTVGGVAVEALSPSV